jgi:hypothetical protein
MLLFLLAGAVGWLWHRPTNLPDAIVSIIVGGAALWFVFGSSISWRKGRHPVPVVRGVWVVLCLVGLVWFMHTVVPPDPRYRAARKLLHTALA